ncbi:MAG: hypothetical protein HC815_39540 [Richelia sp. RM1_1_1]|nr:hypothetical protein [Richelia sp. RM1_1_1]
MGILARITSKVSRTQNTTNIQSSSIESIGHAIDKQTVLRATDSQVYSPVNPGNYNSIRTVPICEDPRYFTKREADGFKRLATEKAESARQSQRAYKSLSKIERSDAIVHKSHRKYEGVVADEELAKLRSNAKQARHLHALRPEYARLGVGLDRADNSATVRIAELKSKAKESF